MKKKGLIGVVIAVVIMLLMTVFPTNDHCSNL